MYLISDVSPRNRSQQILQAAQQRLQTSDRPLLFRIISFLRLSCLVLPEKGAYSKLLKDLSVQDSQWWTTCKITAKGKLTTSNPAIKQLLNPILKLHRGQNLTKVTYLYPESKSAVNSNGN